MLPLSLIEVLLHSGFRRRAAVLAPAGLLDGLHINDLKRILVVFVLFSLIKISCYDVCFPITLFWRSRFLFASSVPFSKACHKIVKNEGTVR